MFKKNDPEKNITKGNIYLKRGLITKARDCYLKALATEPNDISALNNLALVYAILNEEDKAKGYFELVIKECDKQLTDENSISLLTLKSSALMFLNRLNESYDVAGEILKIDPNNITALIQKSQYFEVNNNYSKALTYIDKILTINETDISAMLSKGRILVNLKEFSEAEKFYNKVLENETKNIPALHLKSELIKAKTDCSETPHDFAVRAIECWQREDFENAVKLINKALRMDDSYSELFFIQGELYIRTGRISDAIDSFKKAFEINPNAGGITEKEKMFKLLNKMRKINKILGFEE